MERQDVYKRQPDALSSVTETSPIEKLDDGVGGVTAADGTVTFTPFNGANFPALSYR